MAAPTVTTDSANTITNTSAQLLGTVTATGGSNPTECGVAWSTSANPTTAGAHGVSELVVTGAFSATASSLAPGTTYHYRAYAINVDGTGYGADLIFSTLGLITQHTGTQDLRRGGDNIAAQRPRSNRVSTYNSML